MMLVIPICPFALDLGPDASVELIRFSLGESSGLASRDLSPDRIVDGAQRLAKF
jgi:hypothetical protein